VIQEEIDLTDELSREVFIIVHYDNNELLDLLIETFKDTVTQFEVV
jgi:hypothetical protein